MAERSQHGSRGATAARGDVASFFRIFLNYRREDTAGHAGRLREILAEGSRGHPGFGENQILMDIDAIGHGDDFDETIRAAVEGSDVFLAVIGKHWLTATDSKGRRRLDDPADFVRVEIEAALERNVRLIPVLVEGAEMPSAEELPEPLRPLARRQALEITDAGWRSDSDQLLRRIEKIIGQTPRAGASRDVAVGPGSAPRRAPRAPAVPASPHVPGRPGAIGSAVERAPAGLAGGLGVPARVVDARRRVRAAGRARRGPRVGGRPGSSDPMADRRRMGLRFHRGRREAPGYAREKLRRWADRIARLPASDVYAYFNNDERGAAVDDAKSLAALLAERAVTVAGKAAKP